MVRVSHILAIVLYILATVSYIPVCILAIVNGKGIIHTVDRETFAVKIISRWWLDREIKTHENFS